ncbi:class I SAM-dependent methyltransferase [Mesobacterium sp. TK19101]|uniref:Class I SAM-dependent methyltransferase n=1 Tax=Mesobacterium hydrothermale TaxID=3111907 RepID=A0ABU6HLI2_9RHOB|nr:class I SAM-dependent methyltransferase [Mesobacterium sp. TK19101]MEC3862313.1 class I SAM-dependent methyltransferase [Mesobacterium sp. TK19101]
MDWDAFFTVHKDLPREGPGTQDDVDWACGLADLAPDAVICDAGAGPGGDVSALLAHVPRGRVVAVEKVPGFVRQGQTRFADTPRVSFEEGDMAALADHAQAPFDLIWCAGALYFLGLEAGIAAMAKALKAGGVLAFSEPCFFVDSPSPAARAFWDGYPAQTPETLSKMLQDAGFAVLGQRALPDDSWEAYFRPMERRIAELRTTQSERLEPMLEACAAEADAWRAVRRETGYLLSVARLG